MDPAFLEANLVHTVTVKLWIGTDDYSQVRTVSKGRQRCLVDQSSGKRVVSSATAQTLAYDYAITFGVLDFELHTDSILEDARDEDGSLIFVRARIGQVRIYRRGRPYGGGIFSYLAMAASIE